MKVYITAALLCVCLVLTGCAWGGKNTVTIEVENNRLVPDEEPTHEEVVAHMENLCAAAMDSLARMKEAAAADGADKRGVQAAGRAARKYEPRLAELAAMDYGSMSDEEIVAYMEEISQIIADFREARDILSGLR